MEENLPGITVVKPLKGMDPGLRENLKSFFMLDYPQFELLFCVSDAQEPASLLVKKLQLEFPHVKSRLLVGEVPIGKNPKVNNMVRAFKVAQFDRTVISDSNVRCEPHYLQKMVSYLDADVGMVTSTIRGICPEGFWAQVEGANLNTYLARGMVLASRFGKACVMGKSMLFRRSTLQRFGGLSVLGKYLAEDYMAGQAIQKLGLKVVLASEPVSQILGSYDLDKYWQRHLRWGRIRKMQELLAFLLEPFLFAPVASLLAFLWGGPVMAAATFLFWWFCDFGVARSLGVPFRVLEPLGWGMYQILALPIWWIALLGSTCIWRGQRLEIQPGGLFAEGARI